MPQVPAPVRREASPSPPSSLARRHLASRPNKRSPPVAPSSKSSNAESPQLLSLDSACVAREAEGLLTLSNARRPLTFAVSALSPFAHSWVSSLCSLVAAPSGIGEVMWRSTRSGVGRLEGRSSASEGRGLLARTEGIGPEMVRGKDKGERDAKVERAR